MARKSKRPNHATETQILEDLQRQCEPGEHIYSGLVCRIYKGALTVDGYAKYSALGESLGHRVVYRILGGSIPEGLKINHICDTPACVEFSHLYLGTQLQNIADRQSRDRTSRGVNHSRRVQDAPGYADRLVLFQTAPRDMPSGEEHPSHKLTWEKVRDIRSRYPTESLRSLASTFQVSHKTISNIVKGRTWIE